MPEKNLPGVEQAENPQEQRDFPQPLAEPKAEVDSPQQALSPEPEESMVAVEPETPPSSPVTVESSTPVAPATTATTLEERVIQDEGKVYESAAAASAAISDLEQLAQEVEEK